MESSEKNSRRIREIYKELLTFCLPHFNKHELIRLRKAFELVLIYHRPNWEETGEDYVYHSIEVAKIALKELNLGATSVICALLHNVVDENKVKLSDIEQDFGSEVVTILQGHSALSAIQTEKISVHSDNFRKLYLSLIKDIRVILIKLAHRVNDMRHFQHISKEKQDKFLEEVNHLYIPIAHRLGLYNIKTELEDHWMKHTQSKIYYSIAQKIKDSKTKRKVFIEDFIRPIERELLKQGIQFEVLGRPKSIYSIWRKMKRQNVEFEEVYDLFAIRIIINAGAKNEKDICWKVYSIVTNIYQPNPKRLRDWISSPKASGYESLHTTVIGPNGKWAEVQIRTTRMDEIAEKGLAAHWKYKEGSERKEQEQWMEKIREVIDNPDSEDAMKDLAKVELYSDKIFIFTPEGDLKKLPNGSTVLDFAYEIHTSVGDMCSGARVNGKIVPIRYVLKNGDKVEIITSKNQKPKLDWLNVVITNKAKSKIKRSIKEEKFQEAELGKEMLRRKLRNRKIQFSDSVVDKLIKEYKLKSSIDLYYLIAIEKIDLNDIKKTIEDSSTEALEQKQTEKDQDTSKSAFKSNKDFMLLEDNIDNLDFELAKCCNPISGDAVFGFVTVGKGITIHRINCPNARQLLTKYEYRVIDVKWKQTDENRTYLTTLHVTGLDKVGMLNNITSIISEDFKVNMVSLNVNSQQSGKFDAKLKLSVNDTRHLERLIYKIEKIDGIKKAVRIDLQQGE
jgi:GTP pyrophosphokinase